MITERRRGRKKKSVVRKIRKTGAKEKKKSFAKKINSYIVEHEYNKSILLKLVPLTDVRHTFGSELTFNLSYIRTFTVTGLLLLLCVFFNFTNLLLNRIYLRNKEMKLRNAIGADKKTWLSSCCWN